MTTITQRILDEIALKPGTTNKEVADKLGLTTNTVSATTTQLVQRGRLTRAVVGKTISNINFNGFYIKADPVKKVGNVSKPVANVHKDPAPKRKAEARSLDSMLDEFAGAVALSLASKIKDRLVDELQAIVPTTHPEAIRPLVEEFKQRMLECQAPTKTQLPRVVIAGLLPQQAGMIQFEFHDAFDLVFWNNGDPKSLRGVLTGAAHVIELYTKIGHDTEELIKKYWGTPHRVSGMSEIRTLLTELFVKEGK